MKIGRILLVLAFCLATLGLVACGDQNPQSPLMLPPSSATPAAPTAAPQEPAPASAESAPDSAAAPSGYPVTWTAATGDAREDPLGLLSGTPLTFKGGALQASRNVSFKPNAPDAKTEKGHYTYKISMQPDGVGFSGTMSIVWTMTIDRGTSRNEFRSVYSGRVSCSYDKETNTVSDGVAKGTQKTTDTFYADKAVAPHKTAATFGWTFESAK